MARGLLFVGPQQPPWMASAWGGILLGGEDSRLAGESAAFLYQWQPEPPSDIEVLVPHGLKLRAVGCWTFPQERAGVRGRSVGNPPRTGAADTLLDLIQASQDEGDAMNLVISVMQCSDISVPGLRRCLAARSRLRHRRLVERMLAEVVDGVESALELDYARLVERPHGLPKANRQNVNAVGHRRDVRYDGFATVVELDGRLGHKGMGRFRDMRRDNYAVVRGEAPLRYGSWDVRQLPCIVAREVAGVLTARGWGGVLVSCPNCRSVPTTEGFLH